MITAKMMNSMRTPVKQTSGHLRNILDIYNSKSNFPHEHVKSVIHVI